MRHAICTALLAAAAAFVTCASWNAPSASAVQRAVRESLQKDGVPAGMSGDTFWGEKDVQAQVVVMANG